MKESPKSIIYIAEGKADGNALKNLIKVYDPDGKAISCNPIEKKNSMTNIPQLLKEINKQEYKYHDYFILIADKDENSNDAIQKAIEWESKAPDKNLFILSDPCHELWLSCLLEQDNCSHSYQYNNANCKPESCQACLKKPISKDRLKSITYNKERINRAIEFQKTKNWQNEPTPFTYFHKLIDLLRKETTPKY